MIMQHYCRMIVMFLAALMSGWGAAATGCGALLVQLGGARWALGLA